MSKVCFVCGSKTSFGNQVSKSNIKTRRMYKPNLHHKHFFSEILGVSISVRVSTRGLRTIYKHGSIDAFLLTTKANNLTPDALLMKQRLRRKVKVTPAISTTN